MFPAFPLLKMIRYSNHFVTTHARVSTRLVTLLTGLVILSFFKYQSYEHGFTSITSVTWHVTKKHCICLLQYFWFFFVVVFLFVCVFSYFLTNIDQYVILYFF